jgi:hypothetical protein
MKWVTRKQIRVNRVATAWLIRRFIDPQAEFIFVEPDEVAQVQREQSAKGFDAPGATYPHKDDQGRCSFEALVDEYCSGDPVLKQIARIVRGADFPEEIDLTKESAGIRAISHGFPQVTRDDAETVEKASFLYDALYASLQAELRSA